ncbi:uncharacterized protein LOC62_05G006789 [Vanrija pseudolonga]|uniref:Uncharacterized protein n=1 Tax=Vanrija pseudolonga TaxID=143232 RepID=A0AAF1BJX8_9TREE|nr:hypothetical protein LOC62_05G006789 [Vanrija pseudolonga]
MSASRDPRLRTYLFSLNPVKFPLPYDAMVRFTGSQGSKLVENDATVWFRTATSTFLVFCDKDTVLIVDEHTKKEVSRHKLETPISNTTTGPTSDDRSGTPTQSTGTPSGAPTRVNSPAPGSSGSNAVRRSGWGGYQGPDAAQPPAKRPRINAEDTTQPTSPVPGAVYLSDLAAPGATQVPNDVLPIIRRLNEHTQWAEERASVLAERDSIASERESITAERNTIAAEKEGIDHERKQHTDTRAAWGQEKDRLIADHTSKETAWASEKTELEGKLSLEKNARGLENKKFKTDLENCQREKEKLATDLKEEKAAHAETKQALENEKEVKERMRRALDGL